jgi:acetyl esterase/lipase
LSRSTRRAHILILATASLLATAVQAQTGRGPSAPAASTGISFTRIPKVPEPDAIALYPKIPGDSSAEVWDKIYLGFRVVRNVTHPTLTPVLPPPDKRTGAAVIVVPGGGYTLLQMDIEGWTVAHWLADHGIAAFVLKYRLRQTPPDESEFTAALNQEIAGQYGPKPAPPDADAPFAVEDTIAALKSVRGDSARWGIDPSRVGLIGFSAGAMTAMGAVVKASSADLPNFFGYIYGPMDAVSISSQYGSDDGFTVSANAPPMFAALAMNDPAFGGKGFALVDRWNKAGRPVELHAYERGGHAFGVGLPGTTSTMVMPEFLAWMQSNAFAR